MLSRIHSNGQTITASPPLPARPARQKRYHKIYTLESVSVLVPPGELLAVYDEGGRLVTEPVDALATARVESVAQDDVQDEGTEIVPLRLQHGYWSICADCVNYLGTIRRGQNLQEEFESFLNLDKIAT